MNIFRRIVDDDDDYLALDIADELDMDSFNCPDLSIGHSPEEHYRSPRKKRKRKRKVITDKIIMTDIPEVMLVDHDELPPRARWTIVATACLLFAMSILLVGVTLRMAPIIDDMGECTEYFIFNCVVYVFLCVYMRFCIFFLKYRLHGLLNGSQKRNSFVS